MRLICSLRLPRELKPQLRLSALFALFVQDDARFELLERCKRLGGCCGRVRRVVKVRLDLRVENRLALCKAALHERKLGERSVSERDGVRRTRVAAQWCSSAVRLELVRAVAAVANAVVDARRGDLHARADAHVHKGSE